mmetsp:Transcript_37208/g.105018  ORF Transcript_37208/g.105018 Transcript_37208/m.105018 type:complete len:265 (-) Transcript_37208:131-925(-)
MARRPKVWKVVEGKGGKKYRIERMLEEHKDECLAMVMDGFLQRNKAFVHLQVSATALEAVEKGKTTSCMESGLSLIARDDASDKIAACLFIDQFNMFHTQKPVDQNFQWMYEAAEKMYGAAVKGGSVSLATLVQGRSLHVHLGTTRKEYEGTGAGMCLRAYVETHAALHGFDACLVEPINLATLHIWGKLGWTVCATTVLADFADRNGTKPFENLDREEKFALCTKVINKPSGMWHSSACLPFVLFGYLGNLEGLCVRRYKELQ